MEIFLNLAWAALGVFIVCSWLRTEGSRNGDKRRQLVAIAILVAILFPVISVSDDLLAAQNPAETDTSQRRDHLGDLPSHPLLDLATAMPAATFDGIVIRTHWFSSPRYMAPDTPESPIFTDLQNRPPPAA